MKQGALFFDETADRYDIRFDLADYYGGLHCGECLEVFTGGKWKPTRMEYGDNWYLAGVRAEDLNGLPCVFQGARRGRFDRSLSGVFRKEADTGTKALDPQGVSRL